MERVQHSGPPSSRCLCLDCLSSSVKPSLTAARAHLLLCTLSSFLVKVVHCTYHRLNTAYLLMDLLAISQHSKVNRGMAVLLIVFPVESSAGSHADCLTEAEILTLVLGWLWDECYQNKMRGQRMLTVKTQDYGQSQVRAQVQHMCQKTKSRSKSGMNGCQAYHESNSGVQGQQRILRPTTPQAHQLMGLDLPPKVRGNLWLSARALLCSRRCRAMSADIVLLPVI